MNGLGKRITIWAVLFFMTCFVYAKYKILEIQVKPAGDYLAHQDFQEIVIGAYPFDSLLKVKTIFDTDKISKKGFLPVLLVIENNNSFPIQVFEDEIYLIEKNGNQQRSIYYLDVLLEAFLEDPLSEKSAGKIDKIIKKEVRSDFERKSFGEKLIAPFENDHGIVFFRIPDDGLEDTYLYLPEILNMSDRKPLMFFEFPLK
jgi:hypothetical protein